MRNPGGYATWVGDEQVERDTFTCSHCNSIIIVQPKQDPSEMGGFCTMCSKHICRVCVGEGKCVPFEKKLDMLERASRLGKTLGLNW